MSFGFDIGFTGTRKWRYTKNSKSAQENPETLDKAILKELRLGHAIGPFKQPPFPDMTINALGVRPKRTGGHRIIMDLSQPLGNSINSVISKENFSLSYTSVDKAISLICNHGKGALMAKVDLKHAFRICPVRKQDWPLLGYTWRDLYFFDRVLLFGLRSSPYLFNCLAQALCWITKNKANTEDIIHYLDDYFTVGPANSLMCSEHKSWILAICEHLGVSVSPEKVVGPSTDIEFLGIGLNTENLTVYLPEDKAGQIMEILPQWSARKSCTKRELLSLIGTLSFASKCIPARRMFIRRMIDLSTSVRSLDSHINLNFEFKADIDWWVSFLPKWNGTSPFIQPDWTDAQSLEIFTDASAAVGCAGYCSNAAFQAPSPGGSTNAMRRRAFTPGMGRTTLENLHQVRNHLITNSIQLNTQRTYFTAFRAFQQFCTSHQLSPLPANEDSIALFIAHLFTIGLTFSSIRVYTSAIAFHHTSSGFANSINSSVMLSHVIRGSRLAASNNQRTRLPITAPILRQLKNGLASDKLLSHYNKRMLWSAFITLFAGFFRISEVVSPSASSFHPTRTLLFKDISIKSKSITIWLKSSKTDPFGNGTTVTLGSNGSSLCPHRALSLYEPLRRKLSHNLPAFLLEDGTYLSRSFLFSHLKRLLEMAGFNSSSYSSHSFRIGAATSAAAQGMSPWLIKRLGRWTSECYLLYIQTQSSTLAQATSSICS